MSELQVALVGCGFMGRRHVKGMIKLHEAGLLRARLGALFDLDAGVANDLADYAAGHLGIRPRVYTTLEELLHDKDIRAVDLVTSPATHHTLGNEVMAAGKHLLSEKPLALTVRAARLMVEASERHGVTLATGENYRRGGANRLARAVLDAGLIGRPHLMVEFSAGGDRNVILSRWRHIKEAGAIGLDMGVHYADIIEYLLGPVATVWGRGFIAEPLRLDTDGSSVTATGEDSIVANLRTEGGTDVQFAYVPSGLGKKYWNRSIHGDLGSMQIPRDRSGGDVEVFLDGQVLTGDELRDAVKPHLSLNAVTTATLGPYGIGWPESEWADVDAGYLAVELDDFYGAVLDHRRPEVDGVGGLRALAVVYAALESGASGLPVRVDDVITGRVHAYQDEIDAAIGLGVP